MNDVLQLLREGLLTGRRILVAGPSRPVFTGAIAALGGELLEAPAAPGDEPLAVAPLDALVVDAASAFAATSADPDELAPLRAAADGTWAVVRAAANGAWIDPGQPGGKIVVVAPAPGAGAHAEAARAALENLARTVSIEWARHGIRITTITPADSTPEADIAALVAYLLSPGGDYFSGTRLDLTR